MTSEADTPAIAAQGRPHDELDDVDEAVAAITDEDIGRHLSRTLSSLAR